MKKKTLALLGASALAVLTLTACPAKPSQKTDTTNTGTAPVTTGDGDSTTSTTSYAPLDASALQIAVNYQGKQGISAREAFNNPVENRNYAVNDILPVWTEFSKKIGGTKLTDVSDYSKKNDADNGAGIQTNKYKAGNNYVDIFTTTTANINSFAQKGEIEDLGEHLDEMPNFKAFLEANPTIAASIENPSDGGIYYTPYFDGFNKIERMFLMDTEMIRTLLDSADDAGDTTASGTGAAANTLQAAKFTPFIDANKNYPDATTTVKVSKNAVATDMTIAQTDNIIKQQNELLAAGTTGKALLAQFKAYLTQAFGANVGEGKTYSKLSEIFTSESAAYNTDEMVALMRVVKANPGLLTGDDTAEIEIMVPRQAANNRVENIADFMEAFGIMGLDAETEMLYYGPDGKIHDAAATKATYQALDCLNALYAEGLLLNQFYLNTDSGINGNYLQVYFGHTEQTKAGKDGYGFMMYDYSASTTAMDTKDADGIGTGDDTRVGAYKDKSVTGFTPVLPPLTYWATGEEWKASDDITSRAGKSLIRYSDSNRALKNASWCIPATSDNKAQAIKLLDLLFSAEGVRINDFGPSSYWQDELGTYAGEPTPLFSNDLKSWISNSSKDFWSFMRAYLGATHGIGYVRSASINYQATNQYGKIGTLNIENAISSGAVALATVDTNKFAWDQSVPTAGYGTVSTDNAKLYNAVAAFWSADKCKADAAGWTQYVTTAVTPTTVLGKTADTKVDYTFADVQTQAADGRLYVYLYEKVNGLNPSLVPAEAKKSA